MKRLRPPLDKARSNEQSRLAGNRAPWQDPVAHQMAG